ncbi:hypothetical protein KIN20_028439, partial [Parelaphostrongylus tenuis]
DGPHFRDYCLQLGIITLLLNFITPKTPLGFLRNVTWVIINLCRSKDPPPTHDIVKTILSSLTLMIYHDGIWALSYLAEGGNEQIKLLRERFECYYFRPPCHQVEQMVNWVLSTFSFPCAVDAKDPKVIQECGNSAILFGNLPSTQKTTDTLVLLLRDSREDRVAQKISTFMTVITYSQQIVIDENARR